MWNFGVLMEETIPGRKFCHLHDNNTPSVSGSCLSVQTQEQLGIKKKKGKRLVDDIYTINGVHAKREVGEEKNLEYKITFDKHPDSSFWEPRENIPSFLIRNYEAGKSNIPQAKIKEVIRIGV